MNDEPVPIQVYETADASRTGFGGRFIVRKKNIFRFHHSYNTSTGRRISFQCGWTCGQAKCTAVLQTNDQFRLERDVKADSHCHPALSESELKAKIALAKLKTETLVSFLRLFLLLFIMFLGVC